MKNIRNYLIILLTVVNLICYSQYRIPKDLSINFNPNKNIINPEFYVYNDSDTSLLLFYKQSIAELNQRYKQDSISLKYEVSVLKADNYKNIFKTNFTIRFGMRKDSATYTDKIPLKTPHNSDYMIDITIKDSSNLIVKKTYIPIFRNNANSRNNFVVFQSNNTSIIPTNYITDTCKLIIHSNLHNGYLKVEFNDSTFPSAKSPLEPPTKIIENKQSDSTFTLQFKNNFCQLPIFKKGVYQYYTDTIKNQKFCIIYTNQDFPTQQNPEILLEAIGYLKSNINIDSLKKTQIGSKLELDKFWYFLSDKNTAKARELIRIYYNRMKLTNIMFTTYKEGWKTDRGMVFIIFGLPQKVYTYYDKEIWIYTNKFDYTKNIEFTFKTNTVQVFNDYELENSEPIKQIWKTAIQSWNKGIVFDYNILELKKK